MKRMITTVALALGALAFTAPSASADEPLLSGSESVNIPGGLGYANLDSTAMNSAIFHNAIDGNVGGVPLNSDVVIP